MVPIPHLIAFVGAALLIIVIPGPNVLFAIGRALTLGRRQALLSVLGSVVGSIVPLTVVALGLGTVLMTSALLFTAVKVVGALYLIYLGVTAIRDRKKLSLTANTGAGGRSVRQGFVVGATNPKTAVFFGAVLPQFTAVDAGPLPVQMLVLGVIFLVVQLLCDSVWAVVAATARGWFARSPRRLEAVGGVGGAMVVGVGTGVACTG
ncbi:LysE family translocator [Nocardia caishijiensis]|nr:LysE family translocator [Nocardia caishijiensis]